MWSRVVEVMLGCWLLVSPFVFRMSEDDVLLWGVYLTAALFVICAGLASYVRTLQYAHLMTLLSACLMILFSVIENGMSTATSVDQPIAPSLQNLVVVGLLLLMLGLIPNSASRPPASWENSANCA